MVKIGERGIVASDWAQITRFSREEVTRRCQDGDWEKIDAGSFYALDRFAGYLGADGQRLVQSVQFMPRMIAKGPRAGQPAATWNTPDSEAHSPDSWHYGGRAFDLMFPRNALATAWLTALRFPGWGGIGAYPFWRPDPGLHLDTRPVALAEQGAGFRVLWWVTADGKYRYLDAETDIAEFFVALRAAA